MTGSTMDKRLFESIDDRPVEDIQLEFFYKPHTILLLTASLIPVLYFAFTQDPDADVSTNIWSGVKWIVYFFLVISMLAFPNGPFTRPHPLLWRVVFGLSVLYLMALMFILFQSFSTVRGILYWLSPELRNFSIDKEKVSPDFHWNINHISVILILILLFSNFIVIDRIFFAGVWCQLL